MQYLGIGLYIKLVCVHVQKMQTFPFETRHRNHQLETFEDQELVTRKFLATQVPKFCDWKQIYPFIADDLSSIEFRAPGVLQQFAEYREVEPKELRELLANAQKPDNVSVFTDYCQKVQPPKDKEVLAFFLHGQIKKNLAQHVQESLSSDTAEQQRLIKAIRNYEPEEPLKADMIAEVGAFVASLALQAPVIMEEVEEEQENVACEECDEDERLVVLMTPDKKEWNETEHWENPILKAFKVDAGLATQFSSAKVAKQILLKNCTADAPIGRQLMGKFQQIVPDADFHDAQYPPFALVDALDNDKVEAIVRHPSAQEVYHALLYKPQDNREWIKAMIRVASGVPAETHRKYTLDGYKLHEEVYNNML